MGTSQASLVCCCGQRLRKAPAVVEVQQTDGEPRPASEQDDSAEKQGDETEEEEFDLRTKNTFIEYCRRGLPKRAMKACQAEKEESQEGVERNDSALQGHGADDAKEKVEEFVLQARNTFLEYRRVESSTRRRARCFPRAM